MITSLLWKEWRECRWKMLMLFGVYLLLVLGAWAIEKHAPFTVAQGVIVVLSLVLPGIVAMSTIVDERARRTSNTLQALPVHMSQVFLIKTLAGLATLLLPLMVVEGFCLLVLPGPRDFDAYGEISAGSATGFLSLFGLVTSLYLWILALAAPRRTELGVGATYVMMFVGMAVAYVLLTMAVSFYLRAIQSAPTTIRFVHLVCFSFSFIPLGFIILLQRKRREQGAGARYIVTFAGVAVACVALALLSANVISASPGDVNVRIPNYAAFLLKISPLGFLNPLSQAPDTPEARDFQLTTMILQFLSWLPLWVIAYWRYTRTSTLRVARPTERPKALPRTPLTPQRHPILWKTWREIRTPILACAALIVAFIDLDTLLIQNAITRGQYFSPGPELLIMVPAVISMVIAILLGTDVGLREAEVSLENFWHSRPIPQAAYFRRRFSINLLCALALVILPAALSLGITSWQLANTNPPPPKLSTWPPLRDSYAVQMMLSHLTAARDTAIRFLLFYTPQAILFFSLSAFAASFARRRIIPLVFSFGTAVAFQMLFAETDTARWIRGHWDLAYADFWLPWFQYTFILLTLAAIFAWLATKSATAHWRTRLERLFDRSPAPSSTANLPAAQS